MNLLVAIIADAPLSAALARAAERGFESVELPARDDRPASDLDLLADSGLLVHACRLVGDWPEDPAGQRETLGRWKRQAADAALLGAVMVCVRQSDRERFGEACRLVGEFAAGRMVRLVVLSAPEPVAGCEAELGRDGDRIAYVRLKGDRLTPDVSRALEGLGYQGPVGLKAGE